jgi:hypothetical protein
MHLGRRHRAEIERPNQAFYHLLKTARTDWVLPPASSLPVLQRVSFSWLYSSVFHQISGRNEDELTLLLLSVVDAVV